MHARWTFGIEEIVCFGRYAEWQLIDKPVEKQRDTAADMAAELAGVLARHSALPLPPGDSATIDAYLSRLIRCFFYVVFISHHALNNLNYV